jgi:hypothetical protein
MAIVTTYLRDMAHVRGSGEATDETSYYAPLATLLNAVGGQLSPPVHCVLTPKNRGAGIPDGALFIRRPGVLKAGDRAVEVRAPERGAMEVKGLARRVDDVARSAQVRRYLERYGQVLVSNYRDFLQVRLAADGKLVKGERYSLAGDEEAFWSLAADEAATEHAGLEPFLQRALLADAPLTSPEDVAWFLAAYARTARERLAAVEDPPALRTLRTALEDALGVRFQGARGREFFNSTLIQTLFYGVFAAWVTWSRGQSPSSTERFSWRTAQWTLNVPMVRVLFEQLTTPGHLPVGLDEVLDWTEDVLARIDRARFMTRFESREAVQHFYEPFLQAYDPELRRLLGVWYTPPEVVRYMVARVHEALQRDLGIPLGLADERVHVLDPCTGTGSYLIETVSRIAEVLEDHHGDALVAQQAKEAALKRVHGFELLPAPFVVAHLQLGMLLAEMGAPLEASAGERASIFLTNALTGWADAEEKLLPFEEFRIEREAAGTVKRTQPILVVLGNPPYNGYADVSGAEEFGLLQVYKEGLSQPPWEITKNKLDDYYIRFFRIAERRIAERTGRGIVCFISNFGWLGDPSAVVMRGHLLREFDQIYVDNLNGDSRETGKKTAAGDPDPSVFSSKLNPAGIQVGTAISLFVRADGHTKPASRVLYREFWGASKRAELTGSLEHAQGEPQYERLEPAEKNWFRLRPWRPREGYDTWPRIIDLAAVRPALGLNENRGEALIAHDRQTLDVRLRHFLDADVAFEDLDRTLVAGLLEPWADYDAAKTRSALLQSSPFDEQRLTLIQMRPLDVRWAYVDTTPKLWNRPRPQYLEAAALGSEFLLLRRRAPRALDGAGLLLSAHVVDQHVLHKDAYTIPLLLPVHEDDDADARLFSVDDQARSGIPWRPNLSDEALGYLQDLGYGDIETSRGTGRLLWLHALAVSYAPQYLEENGDAIRHDWPRVPLPMTQDALEESAVLGVRVAALLDIDTPLPGLDTAPLRRLDTIASIGRLDGAAVRAEDLALTCGWGVVQRRTQKSGAVSRVVMPGDGRLEQRSRTAAEASTLTPEDLRLLGDDVLDVNLNDTTVWRGVPLTAWAFKIGGYQVLRKWLSYRDASVLGRPLVLAEARQFQSIARRLSELVRMAPELDANYRACVGAVDQDPLPLGIPIAAA